MSRLIQRIMLSVFALAITADCTWAAVGRGGMGGGRRRSNNDRRNNEEQRNVGVDWEDSLGAAISSAGQDAIPVMAVIRRNLVQEDQKAVDRMASWPQMIQLSQESVAPIKLSAEGPEGKDLITRLGIKTLPAIAWLDPYGNPIMGQPLPDSAAPIAGVVAGWSNTMNGIQKYFKDHETRGEKFLARGKLREAYLEYSFGAAFKGPDAERAKAGQAKVKERWQQLLDYASTLPAESPTKLAVVKGLRKDAHGTDFAAQMETSIAKTNPPAVVAAPAVTEAKPAALLVAAETKSLTEMISSSARLSSTIDRESVDDTSVDTRALKTNGDKRFAEADKLLQDGMVEYKKATADSTERGPARNELLKSAHAKFEKSLSLLEQASAGKPDAQVEKLMEKTSMLMYCTLKYQSL